MKRYRWDAIIDRIDATQPTTIAEIGVWKGGLSRKLLEGLPLMTLIQVDRWSRYTQQEKDAEGNSRMAYYPQKVFDDAMSENDRNIYFYKNRVTMLKHDSLHAVQFIPDKFLDLVFIDAAHSYEGCKADILAWLPKVKPGGWISGHDYLRVGVHRAVHEIFQKATTCGDINCAEAESVKFIETDSNKTWFVRV